MCSCFFEFLEILRRSRNIIFVTFIRCSWNWWLLRYILTSIISSLEISYSRIRIIWMNFILIRCNNRISVGVIVDFNRWSGIIPRTEHYINIIKMFILNWVHACNYIIAEHNRSSKRRCMSCSVSSSPVNIFEFVLFLNDFTSWNEALSGAHFVWERLKKRNLFSNSFFFF